MSNVAANFAIYRFIICCLFTIVGGSCVWFGYHLFSDGAGLLRAADKFSIRNREFTISITGMSAGTALMATSVMWGYWAYSSVPRLRLNASDMEITDGNIQRKFSDEERNEIGRLVRDYVLQNPKLMEEALNEHENRQKSAPSEKESAAIKENSKLLFDSPRQVTLGNPNGQITLVEFFDYNCPYCKTSLGDMSELLSKDPNLRFVLKEFPVLGPASVEAAQVSVAVHLQDKTGNMFLKFHQKLLGGLRPANKELALSVAREVGVDMARLQLDMASRDVKETIAENLHLGEALGIIGTPSYVIGTEVITGAIGYSKLKEKIDKVKH